jgi:dCMP deaminase
VTIDYPGVVKLPPRPTWDEYGMGIAEVVATRSDCTRSQVGAVVLDRSNRVAGTGYNGAPAGMAGCGTCPRAVSDVAPLTAYDNCVAIHAEANALLYTRREDLQGSTLYVTREPCSWCWKLIWGSGVERVVWVDNGGRMPHDWHVALRPGRK